MTNRKGNYAIQAEITIAQHPEWNESKRSIERANAQYKDKQQYIKDNKTIKTITMRAEDWKPVLSWVHGTNEFIPQTFKLDASEISFYDHYRRSNIWEDVAYVRF